MAVQASTPPPSSLVNPPPTPKLGFDDSWIPYLPRKSARLSQRSQMIAQTPPPKSPIQISPKSVAKSVVHIRTPTSSRKRAARSPPVSTANRRVSTANRRVSGSLTSAGAATAAAELGLDKKSGKNVSQRSLTMSLNGMLPTPTKTPKKRPTIEAPEIARIARTLFPVRPDSIDDIMPSPKKDRKNYTLGSFSTEEEDPAPVQIYTDSNERIPQTDLNPDNPFYGDRREIMPEPAKRPSRQRTVFVPGEGEKTLEETEKREDGMIYIFRGRRIFRKFEVNKARSLGETPDQILNAELDSSVSPRIRGPITRSSMKPRLLFPTVEHLAVRTPQSQPSTHDEEEAVTDIEEPRSSTPMAQLACSSFPPGAPRFGNLSPTIRDTRFTKVSNKSSQARLPSPTMSTDERSAPNSPSPFCGRKKTRTSNLGKGKKREGDLIANGENKTSKRRRASRTQPI